MEGIGRLRQEQAVENNAGAIVEHQIRDESDFQRHVDYIHWNPVKHGHVTHVFDWPYFTFHRYVEQNVYSNDWGGVKGDVDASKFGE